MSLYLPTVTVITVSVSLSGAVLIIRDLTPYFTKNSYFGQVDTAGFPKDSYYHYMAEWTDYKTNPMVHLLPYWDFNIRPEN